MIVFLVSVVPPVLVGLIVDGTRDLDACLVGMSSSWSVGMQKS